jgi:hypothetical protein
MNTSGTSSDVFAILAVAQANPPHDPVAGSEAVWRKWSEQLGRYCFEEVATALDRLARTHPRVPSLSELLGELRARRGGMTAHIPSDPPTSDGDQHRSAGPSGCGLRHRTLPRGVREDERPGLDQGAVDRMHPGRG